MELGKNWLCIYVAVVNKFCTYLLQFGIHYISLKLQILISFTIKDIFLVNSDHKINVAHSKVQG